VGGLGVGAGAAIAWLAGRVIDTRQFGLTSVDPTLVGAVAVFLVAVTAAAAIVPAWRASRVDPIMAMRSA
jgi:putative ABC transport system permease protein